MVHLYDFSVMTVFQFEEHNMMEVNEDWGCQKTRYPLDMVMINYPF